MKNRVILIFLIIIIIPIIFFTVQILRCQMLFQEIMKFTPKIPEAIVQYSEIAIESQIAKYKAAQRPDIVRIDRVAPSFPAAGGGAEAWIVVLNERAVQEIQKKGAFVRLHIGYCYWDSDLKDFTVTKHGYGHVIFCPEWHPPYNRNRLTVGLVKNNKYLCSTKVW